MKRLSTLTGLLLLCTAASWAEPAGARATHRLGPGAERSVARCVGLDQPRLTETCELQGIEVDRDHVRLKVTLGERNASLSLYAPDDPRSALRKTKVASVLAGDDIPPAVLDAVVARLDACTRTIPFVREVATVSPEERAQEIDALRLRVGGRLGREALGEDPGQARPSPSLLAIYDAVRAGRLEEARAQVRPLLQGTYPSTGALSLWLAAQGGAEVCLDGQRCVAGEVVTDLFDGHLHGEWAARWSNEPRLLLLAAERAANLGDHPRARAFLLAALASDLPDQAAVDLAVGWGWGPGQDIGGLPSRPQAAAGEERGGASDLLLILAALLLALAWWSARDERWGVLLTAAGLIGAVALASLMPAGGKADSSPAWEMPGEAQLGWARGAGCALGWPTVMDGVMVAPMNCEGEQLGVMVRAEGGRLALSVMPRSGSGTLSEATKRWKRTVEQQEDTGLVDALQRVEAPEPGLGDLSTRLGRLEPHQRRAIEQTGPVAMVAAVAILGLLMMALRTLWSGARARRTETWRLAGAAGIALVTHLVAPAAMVMVYGGYGQVIELVDWQPLRYGAGANWLYGPWLELFGYDHAVVQTLNRLYGLLTLVFLSAWAERLVARSGGTVALLLSLSPILWRDHASESILVGGMMMLAAGLWGLSRAEPGRVASALLALPCLCLAAMTRPEFALFSIPLVLLTGFQLWDRAALKSADWRGLGLGLAAALLLAPGVFAYLEASTRWMVQTGALPGLESLSSRLMGDAVNPVRAFADLAEWTPWVTLPLALMACLWSGSRALGIGTLVVGLAWMAFTRVDLPAVSIPRVHAPVCSLLVVLAGVGLSGGVERLLSLPWRRVVKVGLLAAVSLGWAVEVPLITSSLYAPTNAESEERLLRGAEVAISGEGVCLATLDSRDAPPRGKTPRVWPSYLFTGRDAPVRLLGLGELEGARTVCSGDTYALLGVRCYMALRDEQTNEPPPSGSPMVESCARFKETWKLEPVIERDVENHGDLAYPMYPDGAQLRIGLYRVLTGGAAAEPGTEDRHSQPR